MFLVDTMHSESYAIKHCHKMDAARLLTKYGGAQPAHDNNTIGATLVVAHSDDDPVRP